MTDIAEPLKVGDAMTDLQQAFERRAIARYRDEARFHSLAQRVAARVVHEYGRIDPERADRDVQDIAERVAILVMETFYEEDAELKAQREIADHYKKIAEGVVRLSPPPFFRANPQT